MKVCFIACGPISWASARLRCHWPARYIKDAAVVEYNAKNDYPDADAYVWQKRINQKAMREQRAAGKRVYLDMCDPTWWWEPKLTAEVLAECDAVVCSSPALRFDLAQFSPQTQAVCIPDRMELSHFLRTRTHAEVTPLRLIWFGLHFNRVSLFGAIANLERLAANGHAIELTIFDDRPDVILNYTDAFPVYNTEWSVERENEVIAAHDIAVLPPYPGAWGKVKSNNKQLTAWACGLPTTTAEEYFALETMASDVLTRQMISRAGLASLKHDWDVRQSAAEWESLLCA
jgi:hypothetical protein